MDVELTFKGSVESLHLEPGDRIIVTLDDKRRPCAEEMQQLREAVRQAFPDYEVVVLAAGLRIAKEAAA